MEQLRLLGSTIRKLSSENGVTENQMQELLNCSYDQVSAVYDGRVFPSFSELQQLAARFGTTVEALIKGDEEYYNTHFVHCMGKFKNPKNREKILDIIEDYLTLLDAVSE